MTLHFLPVPPVANDHPPRVWLSDTLQIMLSNQHHGWVHDARQMRAAGFPNVARMLDGFAASLRAELSGHGCEALAAKLARNAEGVPCTK